MKKSLIVPLLLVVGGLFVVTCAMATQPRGNWFSNKVSSIKNKILNIRSSKKGTPVLTVGNPFGVMFANATKAQYATHLGAVYYRPTALFVDKWNGSCAECDAALQAGLKLVLTVRNNGGSKQPTTPPKDMNAYKKTLGEMIDKYKPVVLVVENEENSKALFYAGTTEQYHAQLKAACEIAHSKGVKCTNGGFVSSLVVLLVADEYMMQGKTAEAKDFLTRTLGEKLDAQFGALPNGDITMILENKKAKDQLALAKALMAGYKTAGADYSNFHWYVADIDALGTAKTFMETTTGLPAMSNEVGQQRNTDPKQVTSVMQKVVDLKLPYAIWFSVDVAGYGEATSLINENGTLRPNGEAYKAFIETHF